MPLNKLPVAVGHWTGFFADPDFGVKGATLAVIGHFGDVAAARCVRFS